jgi:hypothetical protein
MHVGIIFLGIILGSVAAGICLVSGYSVWISLAAYSAVGSGGALIVAVTGFATPAAQRGDLAIHRRVAPEFTLNER